MIASTLVLAALAGTVQSAALASGPTGPQNPQVVSGSARFSQSGSRWTITTSNTAIINYSSFNLNAGQAVRFIQPSSSSRVLNRITGAEPTRINGRIDANGTVYFVNRAGVFFGPNATINTGQFYAAAGSLSDRDFLGRVDRFTGVRGTVENRGSIVAQGSVSLVGAQVANYGNISGLEGSVVMAAGDEVVVSQPGSRLSVRVQGDSTPGNDTDRAAMASVHNAGNIGARMGIVAAAGDIASLAISNTGTMRASRVELQGGRGHTLVSGTIDASNASGRGGRVDITGERIALVDATVNASGSTGGGQVNIGGELHGGGTLPRAQSTYVSAGSGISADATVAGDGGQIVVWSDQVTGFYGGASANGAGAGGNGGLIETSSAGSFNVVGSRISARAGVGGAAGLWLIDPFDVEIVAGATSNGAFALGVFTPSATPSQVSAADIVATLFGTNGADGTNVQVTTTGAGAEAGNITISAPINTTNTVTRTLTFSAIGGITQNAAITATAGSLNLVYDAAAATVVNANVVTLGGSVTVNGTDFNLASGQTVTTGGGGVSLNGTGTVTINGTMNLQGSAAGIAGGALTASGTDFTVSGTGSVNTSGNGNADGGVITINSTGAVILNGTVTTNGNVVGSSVSAAPAFSALNASSFATGAGGGLTVGTGTRSGNISISATGNVTLSGPVSGNTIGVVGSVIRLRSTGGNITQNTGGTIVGGALVALAPSGSVSLDTLNNNLQTATDTSAAAGFLAGTSDGSFAFSNGTSLGLNVLGAQGSFGVTGGITSSNGNVSITTRNTNSIFQMSGSGANSAGITALNGVVSIQVVGTGSLAVEQGALAPIAAQELVLGLVNPGGGFVGGQFELNGSDNRIGLLTANLGSATAVLTSVRLVNNNAGAGLADWQIGNVTLPTGAASNFLRVTTSRAVTQGVATGITANGLLLLGTGSYTLSNAANNVVTLAAGAPGSGATSPSSIVYVDTGALAVGTVDGVAGVTTNGGDVTLDTGALTITQAINLGATGGVLRLDVDGVTQSGAGVITANALGLLANGAVTLNLSNDVNTLALDQNGNFASAFTGVGGYDVGAVTGTATWNANAALNGIDTAGTLVTLTAPTGAVTQSQVVTAPSLELLGAGSFDLGTQNNAITTLAANLTGAASFLRFRDDTGFAVGTAGATAGIVDANLVALRSDGTITQTASINADELVVRGAGSATLDTQANVVPLISFNLTGGASAFRFSGGAYAIGTVDGNASSLANLVALSASGAVTQTQAFTATGGLVLRGAGSFALDTQSNTVGDLAANLTGGGGTPSFVRLRDDGGINVGTVDTIAGVTVSPAGTAAGSVAGNIVVLNGGAGGITQTQAIIANGLALIGTANATLNNAGNDVVTLAGALTGPGTNLRFRDDTGFAIGQVGATRGLAAQVLIALTTDGQVTQSTSALDLVSTSSLVLRGAGRYSLENNANLVAVLAASLTGGGGTPSTVVINDADGLVIGSFDGVSGVTLGTGGVVGQDLCISLVTGSLTQTQAIVANGLAVLGGASATLTNAGNDIAQLAANTTGTIRYSDSNDFAVGTASGVNGITTGTGGGAVCSLVLSGANITQTQAITTNWLCVLATDGVVLTNAGNSVNILEGSVANNTGTFAFRNAGALSIGATGENDGLTTSNGDVAIQTGGLLTITERLDAGTGGITLTSSAGATQSGTGVITASALLLGGGGTFDLISLNNDVDTLAGESTSGTRAILFRDDDGFTIGSALVLGVSRSGLNVGTGGLVVLESDASVTQGALAGEAVITGGLALQGDGAFTLDNAANDAGTIAANTGGAIVFHDDNGLIVGTVDRDPTAGTSNLVGITTTDDSVTLRVNRGGTAGQRLAIGQAINLGATGGTLTLLASDGAGAEIGGASVGVQAEGAITADAVVVDSVGGNVLLNRTVAGVPINDVNVVEALINGNPGSFSFATQGDLTVGRVGGLDGVATDNSLIRLVATGALVLGERVNAGVNTLVVDAASVNNVDLQAGAGVTQVDTGTGVVTADVLTLAGQGAFLLNTQNNRVLTVQAPTMSGAGQSIRLRALDTLLSLGQIGDPNVARSLGLVEIQSNQNVVQVAGARLRLETLVLSGTGSFVLLEPGLPLFGSNDIATLVADLGGAASSVVISDSTGFVIGSADVTRLFNADNSVHTGGALDAHGGVRLAAYDGVNPGSAPRLVPGADNDLVIIGGNTTGGVTQTAPIVADGLGLSGEGPFVLTSAGNLVNQLASLDAGPITLVNGQSLVIGEIDGTNVPVGQRFVGVNNDGAEPALVPDLTLRIDGGSLRINQVVNLGGTRPVAQFGTFRATVIASAGAGGVSQASTGVITAAGLGVINNEVARAAGAREGIQLFDADNRVNTVALRNIGVGPGTQMAFNGVGTGATSTSYTIGTIAGAPEFDSDGSTAGDQALAGISSADDAGAALPTAVLQLGSSNGVSAQSVAFEATSLALLGSGGHNLGTQNNAVGTVAAQMTDAGAGNVVRVRDDGGLVIGTVATIVNSAAGSISGIDVGLQADDVITLVSDGAVTQASATDNLTGTSLVLRGAGQFELNNIDNDVDVLAALLTGATATASFADDDGFEVGQVVDLAGTVNGVDVNGGVADANDLRLRSNGAVTQTRAIVADGLFLERDGTTGSFTFTVATNNIEDLAALNAGNIVLVNSDNVIVGTVGTSNGIDNSANGGDLTLRTVAGGVAINQAVNLGTVALTRGTLRITAVGSATNGGVSQASAGVITAAALGVVNDETARAGAARVGIVLNEADNVVGTLALRNIATGASSAMAFRGIGDGAATTSYTIGTVTGAAEFDADAGTAGNQDLVGVSQRQTPGGADESIRLLSLTSNNGRAAQSVAFDAALLALRGDGGFIFDTHNNVVGAVAGVLTDNGAGNVVRLRDDAGIALGSADSLNGINLGQQVGDLLVLQSDGDVTQAANAPVQATSLALRGMGGNRNLRTSSSNDVQFFASEGGADVQYLDTNSFAVADVDGVVGITGTGLVDLDAGGGNTNTITLERDIVTTLSVGAATGGPLGVRGVILRDRALISGPRTVNAGAGVIRLMNGADAAGGGGGLTLTTTWPTRGLATTSVIDADAQTTTPPSAPPDVPAIGVAGSIGAVAPLDSLTLGGDLALGPATPNAATIVFANAWQAFNSSGNSNVYNAGTDVGSPIRVANTVSGASSFTVATTGNLTMGNLQRLLSFGSLSLNSSGGTVRLGDVTSVGSLNVSGNAIQIMTRPLGQLIRSNRLSENEVHPGDVNGTDIVANTINFSVQPTLVTANGVNAASAVRGNVFGLANIGGSSVPGFTDVQDGFRLIRTPLSVGQFRNVNSSGVSAGRILALDVDSRGDTAFTGSVIPPLFTVFDLPEVDQGVRITGAVEEFLRRLQVNVSSEDAAALASALIGTAVFNNDTVAIDRDEPAFQSILSEQHRVSVGRLSGQIADEARLRYNDLFIGPDAANPVSGQMKRRLGELHTAWSSQSGGAGGMGEFRSYIASTDPAVDTFLNQLSNFLTDFGFIGLTGSEFSVPRAALLNQVRPTDVDADGGVIEPADFFQLVTGQRATSQVATRSIELRFDEIFLSQVPRVDENGKPIGDGSMDDRFNAIRASLGAALKAYGQANAQNAKDGSVAGSAGGFASFVEANDPVAAGYLREVRGFLAEVERYASSNNVEPGWAEETRRKTLDMVRPGNIDPAAFADLLSEPQVSASGW
jgi:filamentous hemagglutinin family protein